MQEVLLPGRMNDGVSGKSEQCAAECGERKEREDPRRSGQRPGEMGRDEADEAHRAAEGYDGRHQEHRCRENGMSQRRHRDAEAAGVGLAQK